MRLKVLVGAGDRVMGSTLPFAAVGIAANILWPGVFRMGFGTGGLIAGIVLLVVGVPLWITSAIQILVWVPRKTLITTGPFAIVAHPIYTFFALLVLPGVGLVLDTWLGFAVGAVLYSFVRVFAGSEEKLLASFFPKEYPAYRSKVLIPWL
jgi:protein-S-isoprenylcysteine O-methyltransferase Ste14